MSKEKYITNDKLLEHLAKKEFFSPSEISTYMQCPYCWYIKYCLRQNNLDNTFNSLDKGNILHKTLEIVYQPLIEDQNSIDDKENYLLSRVDKSFEEALNIEFKKGVGRDLLYSDKQVLEELKRDIKEEIKDDIRTFTHFKPYALEFKVTKEDKIEYAGAYIQGKIDRVDCYQNHFIVIDYKSGVSQVKPYNDKNIGQYLVQTAIYASVLEKKFKKKAVGALYKSIKNRSWGGALDGTFFDELDLNLSKDYKKIAIAPEFDSEFSTFSDYLNFIESQAQKAIESIRKGFISPNVSTYSNPYVYHESVCKKLGNLYG